MSVRFAGSERLKAVEAYHAVHARAECSASDRERVSKGDKRSAKRSSTANGAQVRAGSSVEAPLFWTSLRLNKFVIGSHVCRAGGARLGACECGRRRRG